MFRLTIAFGETPAMWRLLFKTEDRANQAWLRMKGTINSELDLEDDFGQHCCIMLNYFRGAMLEDLDQSKQAGVEMMLHNARTQAQAQAQARQEPALRSAGQGPSVFVPGMNGRN